jgi:hypothetical protein
MVEPEGEMKFLLIAGCVFLTGCVHIQTKAERQEDLTRFAVLQTEIHSLTYSIERIRERLRNQLSTDEMDDLIKGREELSR